MKNDPSIFIPEFIKNIAAKRYFPFVLLTVSIVDYFIMIVPSDAFLIAGVLGNTKRARSFCGWMLLCRTIAIVGVYALSSHIPLERVHDLAMHYHLSGAWDKGQYFFESFGPLSVGIIALTPFAMIFPTFMSAFAGAPLWQVLVFGLAGSGLRYAILTVSLISGKKYYQKHHTPT